MEVSLNFAPILVFILEILPIIFTSNDESNDGEWHHYALVVDGEPPTSSNLFTRRWYCAGAHKIVTDINQLTFDSSSTEAKIVPTPIS